MHDDSIHLFPRFAGDSWKVRKADKFSLETSSKPNCIKKPIKRMDMFSVNVFSFFSGNCFHVFSLTVFAFASAGSALQALGAAERARDEAPKPA